MPHTIRVRPHMNRALRLEGIRGLPFSAYVIYLNNLIAQSRVDQNNGLYADQLTLITSAYVHRALQKAKTVPTREIREARMQYIVSICVLSINSNCLQCYIFFLPLNS